MQIQEVGVGQKTTTTNAPFVGQIRHFMFNGIDPLSEPRYLVETPLLKWLSPSPAMQIEHAITLKTPECFLRLPRLSVYGAFRVSFAIKTRQEDGVVLFNSGGGDFILVELVNAHLTISFDMGHGTALKYQRIGRDHLSDGKWHKITISRYSYFHHLTILRHFIHYREELRISALKFRQIALKFPSFMIYDLFTHGECCWSSINIIFIALISIPLLINTHYLPNSRPNVEPDLSIKIKLDCIGIETQKFKENIN